MKMNCFFNNVPNYFHSNTRKPLQDNEVAELPSKLETESCNSGKTTVKELYLSLLTSKKCKLHKCNVYVDKTRFF